MVIVVHLSFSSFFRPSFAFSDWNESDILKENEREKGDFLPFAPLLKWNGSQANDVHQWWMFQLSEMEKNGKTMKTIETVFSYFFFQWSS